MGFNHVHLLHTKELIEANVANEVMNGHDSLTRLCLYMVAVMGDGHDLSAIYGIMRMSSETRASTVLLHMICYSIPSKQ